MIYWYNEVMKDIVKQLTGLLNQVDNAIDALSLEADEAKLAGMEEQMIASDFWQDTMQAEQVSREAAELKRYIGSWRDLREELATTLELAELSSDSQSSEFSDLLADYNRRVGEQMLALKLGGEHDKAAAIIQLSAGVGGTDAADWAQMLETMYIKYANTHGYSVEVLEESPSEEAGIKSATLRVSGPFAFGKLKGESGVHRLVRLSPFNSDNLRQTSFALVEVLPEIVATESVLDPKDLRVDVYRSSGHGGQSVNTTDSAVRLTHIPTGMTVAVQNERSQLKNKQMALSILAAKLNKLAEEQHLANVSDLKTSSKSADWGAQIRNYVLHPYQKVKDVRTGYETSDTTGVLAGELEPFIEAYLNKQVGNADGKRQK